MKSIQRRRREKKGKRVFVVAAVTVKQHTKKYEDRRPGRTMRKAVKVRAVPEKIQLIAPETVQRKIFEGDSFTLGDSIGTCLEIDFPEWKPMFEVGGMVRDRKEKDN